MRAEDWRISRADPKFDGKRCPLGKNGNARVFEEWDVLLVLSKCIPIYIYMCQGLNSHYFHIIGDGHQPNSRGLYTHYKDSY